MTFSSMLIRYPEQFSSLFRCRCFFVFFNEGKWPKLVSLVHTMDIYAAVAAFHIISAICIAIHSAYIDENSLKHNAIITKPWANNMLYKRNNNCSYVFFFGEHTSGKCVVQVFFPSFILLCTFNWSFLSFGWQIFTTKFF